MKSKIILLSCFILFFSGNVFAQGFNIYSDFPSGNIIIEKIKNDTIWMRPDLRDTKGEWFYWCFAVSKAKDKTLTFVFTKPNVYPALGPSVSCDSGFNWKWLGVGAISNESFSYTFKTDHEVRFSMGMPYTQKQFDIFIRPYLKSDLVTLDPLAKTKSGRIIERLIIKPINTEGKYKILITARHHACEMMANYVIEGMIREIMKDKWLKDNVEFCFIPFVDKDGVENGDQGKNRIPRDHNRDYSDTSVHESTSALRNWVPVWGGNKLAVCMDLHCPWIKGINNENIQVVGSADVKIAEQQKLFCQILKGTNNGELKVSENIYLPYGTDWNTIGNYSQGFSFVKWVSTIDGVKLPISFEIPYANNGGQPITQDNTRMFGQDIARTIKLYLMQL